MRCSRKQCDLKQINRQRQLTLSSITMVSRSKTFRKLLLTKTACILLSAFIIHGLMFHYEPVPSYGQPASSPTGNAINNITGLFSAMSADVGNKVKHLKSLAHFSLDKLCPSLEGGLMYTTRFKEGTTRGVYAMRDGSVVKHVELRNAMMFEREVAAYAYLQSQNLT